MHIGGSGQPETLPCSEVGRGRDQEQRAAQPSPEVGVRKEIPPSREQWMWRHRVILGHKGQLQDGILKVTIGRQGMMHGIEVGGSMGLTTWAAFTGGNAQRSSTAISS